MTIEKSPERRPATRNLLLVHLRQYLIQGAIRVLGNQSKDALCVVLQDRAAAAGGGKASRLGAPVGLRST
jgi:hypothetical protein